MNTVILPRRAEFVFYRPENLILVENDGDNVVVRARRNNFSAARKRAFIHELAAEGFIPDHFEWAVETAYGNEIPGVEWRIDGSWAEGRPAIVHRSNQPLLKILLSSGVLWLLLMGLLLTRLL